MVSGPSRWQILEVGPHVFPLSILLSQGVFRSQKMAGRQAPISNIDTIWRTSHGETHISCWKSSKALCLSQDLLAPKKGCINSIATVVSWCLNMFKSSKKNRMFTAVHLCYHTISVSYVHGLSPSKKHTPKNKIMWSDPWYIQNTSEFSQIFHF